MYDDAAVFVKNPIIPALTSEQVATMRRLVPDMTLFTAVVSSAILAPSYAYASSVSSLQGKEQHIIKMLQEIAVPAAIAIAIWGLIDWAILSNASGKKKIWDSLWLLIGIKFIPDIWSSIAN